MAARASIPPDAQPEGRADGPLHGGCAKSDADAGARVKGGHGAVA